MVLAKTDHWNRHKKDVHKALFSAYESLKDQHEERQQRDRRYLSLYTNRRYTGLTAGKANWEENTEDLWGRPRGLVINVLKSIVDTLVANIASTKPRPMPIAQAGEFSDRQKCKLLEQYLHGVFEDCDVYGEARRMFLDALLFGSGFLKICPAGGRVLVERVFPAELAVDEQTALLSEPRSLYQIKEVAAEVLAGRFPKHREAIFQSVQDEGVPASSQDVHLTDMVRVIEAWHKPSAKGEKDGRHVIAVAQATLVDEQWAKDCFPILKFDFSEMPLGWFGQGLPEQYRNLIAEINKITHRLSEVAHYYAKVDTYVPQGSIKKEHLKNSSGNIIEYDPSLGAPISRAQGSMPNDFFSYRDDLIRKMYELVGVNELSAQAKRPVGIESGIALQHLADQQTLRWADLSDRWHSLFPKIAERVIDAGKEIHKQSGDYRVWYRGRDFVKRIPWSEVDMDRDRFVITTYPANLLPQLPSGRYQRIREMMQDGFVGPEEAMALMDMPDVDKFMKLSNAALDDIDSIIEKIMVDGEYIEPQPFQNLELGLKRFTQELLRARVNGAPKKRTDLLQRWITDATDLLAPPEPPAPPPQPEGPPMPPPEMAAPPMAPGNGAPPPDMPVPPELLPPQA